MAILNTTRTSNGTASAVNHFFAAINSVLANVAAWNDARATRNELLALTDRELQDIGLTRGQIDSVADSNLIR